MGTLKKFSKERKLELCVEKTKIMVFNNRIKRKKKTWKWDKRTIEEVKNFKYLGFTFSKNEKYTEHFKELGRKERLAVNKI